MHLELVTTRTSPRPAGRGATRIEGAAAAGLAAGRALAAWRHGNRKEQGDWNSITRLPVGLICRKKEIANLIAAAAKLLSNQGSKIAPFCANCIQRCSGQDWCSWGVRVWVAPPTGWHKNGGTGPDSPFPSSDNTQHSDTHRSGPHTHTKLPAATSQSSSRAAIGCLSCRRALAVYEATAVGGVDLLLLCQAPASNGAFSFTRTHADGFRM